MCGIFKYLLYTQSDSKHSKRAKWKHFPAWLEETLNPNSEKKFILILRRHEMPDTNCKHLLSVSVTPAAHPRRLTN